MTVENVGREDITPVELSRISDDEIDVLATVGPTYEPVARSPRRPAAEHDHVSTSDCPLALNPE